MTIEVRITQNDRLATIELINSGNALFNPNFSLQISSSLYGASYSSTQLSGSGSLSTKVSSTNGNLIVDATGSASGTYGTGSTLLLIELQVSSSGSISVDDVSGSIDGLVANATIPPSLTLVDPAPEMSDFIEGTFEVGETLSIDVDNLPDWSPSLSPILSNFQWFRDGQSIVGVTSDSYLVTDADVGSEITATVDYTDSNFSDRSVTDNEGEVVIAATTSTPPTTDAPEISDMPSVIASNGSFQIVSESGSVITEDTVSEGTQGLGREITFTVLQSNPTLKSVFLQITPESNGATTGDFWEVFFSNVIGGEPATPFDLSTFVNVEDGSGQASFNLNADNKIEDDEVFRVSIFDSVTSNTPLLSGTFTITDDDPVDNVTPTEPSQGLNILGDANPSDNKDILVGEAGDDNISGLTGNDELTGNAGDEILDGGSGIDTAVYSGDQSSYTLTLSPTSTTITDRRSDGNGTDTLIEMEFLDFDSGTFDPFNLDIFGGPAGLDPVELESFVELYIAYFNRAPDAIGLNFWGTQFANGTTLEEMAALFAPQDETLATYPPGTSNEDFATAVYNNVLGRDPDLDGFNFWVGQLDAGNFSRDQFILEVLRGVQPGNSDRLYLDNKVDIGAYFAVHKGMSDGDNAAAAMDIFDNSGVNAAVAAIDGFYADALDPASGEFLMQVVGVLDDPFAVA